MSRAGCGVGAAPEAIGFPQELAGQMCRRASGTPQLEICGLIVARRGRPLRCIDVDNVAAEPGHRFSMDPQQLIAAFRQMREQGEELFGIYHSHPDGSPLPSPIDIAEAGYPDVLQFIVALQPQRGAQLYAYRYCDGKIQSLRLDISADN